MPYWMWPFLKYVDKTWIDSPSGQVWQTYREWRMASESTQQHSSQHSQHPSQHSQHSKQRSPAQLWVVSTAPLDSWGNRNSLQAAADFLSGTTAKLHHALLGALRNVVNSVRSLRFRYNVQFAEIWHCRWTEPLDWWAAGFERSQWWDRRLSRVREKP